jgi:hypothetical protein
MSNCCTGTVTALSRVEVVESRLFSSIRVASFSSTPFLPGSIFWIRFRMEAVAGQLVGDLAQDGDRLGVAPGQDQGVRELDPQLTLLGPLAQLLLQHLDRLRVLLAGDQVRHRDDAVLRALAQPVEDHDCRSG